MHLFRFALATVTRDENLTEAAHSVALGISENYIIYFY